MAQRPSEWRGSVFKPADKPTLWLKIKIDGAWKKRPTPYVPGEERQAEELLAEVREQLLARAAAMHGAPGPVTVRAWSQQWIKTRRSSRRDDESILRCHVLPAIGPMMLADVETRHVLELVESWQPKDDHGNPAPGAPAPRTVRNWYGTVACMFRDAAIRGLIPVTPCVLRTPHLPPAEDADSEWRVTASFTRAELEQLITPHPAIEPDSTVTYAALGLAALRHGELAALRWRHLVEREPLAGLLIANSNAKRRTKKGKTRLVPVHPTLAAILAEWKASGWRALIGREPTPDDLVLPLPLQLATGRKVSGKRPHLQVGEDTRRRTKDFTWRRAERHLEALKLRHRRVHDLRRTFVVLATAAGADDRILQWGTHGRPGDILGQYGEADWSRLCAEWSKLRIARARRGRVVALRK